jgi:hypothetical protein
VLWTAACMLRTVVATVQSLMPVEP